MKNQQEVWNSIAVPWKSFRVNPIPEVSEFLKNKNGKILDLGCGSGRNFTKVNGKIYGVDFSEEMLKHAKKFVEKNKFDVELAKAEAFDLPFKNNFFDAAICAAVLHCIPDAEKRETALRELFRVLKPNAEAWFSVWDKNQKKFKDAEKEIFIPWKYKGKEYNRYYYLYDKREYLDLLKKTGFEIIQANNSENPNGFNSKRNVDVVARKSG
ncbi:class I SAM-dependent methyltransferase [Candidatus Pacearchaeota archaeon]|nr:class I SAM-dependent methyltransferase [Candidatus Pacearchaeota archaeon]